MTAVTAPRTRQRSFEWADPAETRRQIASMTGREWLQGIKAGTVAEPPAASLVGLEVERVDEDEIVFALMPAEYHYNPAGTVHGGILTTLADTAMTTAVIAKLPGRRLGADYRTESELHPPGDRSHWPHPRCRAGHPCRHRRRPSPRRTSSMMTVGCSRTRRPPVRSGTGRRMMDIEYQFNAMEQERWREAQALRIANEARLRKPPRCNSKRSTEGERQSPDAAPAGRRAPIRPA